MIMRASLLIMSIRLVGLTAGFHPAMVPFSVSQIKMAPDLVLGIRNWFPELGFHTMPVGVAGGVVAGGTGIFTTSGTMAPLPS